MLSQCRDREKPCAAFYGQIPHASAACSGGPSGCGRLALGREQSTRLYAATAKQLLSNLETGIQGTKSVSQTLPSSHLTTSGGEGLPPDRVSGIPTLYAKDEIYRELLHRIAPLMIVTGAPGPSRYTAQRSRTAAERARDCPAVLGAPPRSPPSIAV